MSMHRTPAIVLRRTNYGEADRILQLLTPDGKQSVMAKSVRKEKSRLAGGIELFAISDVVINDGKGDLGILTSARLIHFYNHIMEDYDRMQFGYEVIKQVGKASEMVSEPEWYDILSEILAALDVSTIPLPLIQAWFYLHYASLLGHGLSLEYDVDGQPLLAGQQYRYDISEQGLRLLPTGELHTEHIKLLRLLATRSLQVLVQVGGVRDILPACLLVAREHAAL